MEYHCQDERARGRNACRLRPDRRMERPPGSRHLLGGESALFDKLAEQKLVARLDLPQVVVDAIPASIGKPKPIPLKDPKGFWIGTVLEPYGIVYQPKVLQRLGVPEPKDWDDCSIPSSRAMSRNVRQRPRAAATRLMK